MVDIAINSDLKETIKGLRLFKKQIPFATSLALNQTAFDARAALEKKTRQVFKKPTKFTQRPIFVKKSSKRNLVASVEIKSSTGDNLGLVPGIKGGGGQWSYFKHNIEGGIRPLKGYERSMRNSGLLPNGMYTVPAKGIPLNKFGNITRGRIQKMTASIRTNALSGTNTASGGKFFVARIKGVHGVWERMAGRRIRLFLLFVKAPRYRKRYPYQQTVDRVVKNKIVFNFNVALRKAIDSANLKTSFKKVLR